MVFILVENVCGFYIIFFGVPNPEASLSMWGLMALCGPKCLTPQHKALNFSV